MGSTSGDIQSKYHNPVAEFPAGVIAQNFLFIDDDNIYKRGMWEYFVTSNPSTPTINWD